MRLVYIKGTEYELRAECRLTSPARPTTSEVDTTELGRAIRARLEVVWAREGLEGRRAMGQIWPTPVATCANVRIARHKFERCTIVPVLVYLEKWM
eukprot:6212765-Pleurochrysis_carterae.AAC.2